MKRNFLVMLLIIVIFSVCLIPNTLGYKKGNDGVITWKVSTCWTPSINLIDGDNHMCEIVEKMSGGRLKIEFYPAGSIIGVNELFDAVSGGMLDAASDYPGYWTGKEPALDFYFAMSMGMSANDMQLWLYHGGGLELLQEIYAKYKMVYFPVGLAGMESGLRSNRPLRTIKDFKGLKARWGSRPAAYVGQKLGASPVSIAGGEIYTALERKTIDAAEFSMPSTDWGMGFQEVTKYWCLPGWHQPMWGGGWMINKKSWDVLPGDLKEIVKVAARETGAWTLAKWEYESIEATNKFLQKGTVVTRLDKEAQAAVDKYVIEYVEMQAKKNAMFKKVAKSYYDYLKAFSTWRKMEVDSGYGFGHNKTIYPKL